VHARTRVAHYRNLLKLRNKHVTSEYYDVVILQDLITPLHIKLCIQIVFAHINNVDSCSCSPVQVFYAETL
jgi:hypothetical protein